jgi:hypothetical protein
MSAHANDVFTRRDREAADAADRHHASVQKMLREAGADLREAVADHLNDHQDRLCMIAAISEADPAEAGILLREFVRDAAHSMARAKLGDDAEVIEEKRPTETLDDILADFRSGKAFGIKTGEKA